MMSYVVLAILLGLAAWSAIALALGMDGDGYGRPERVPQKPVPFGGSPSGTP